MGDHELNSISCDQILQDSSSRDSPSDCVKRRHSRVCILTGFVFVLGVSCLVVGVVLIALSQTQKSATTCKTTATAVDEKDTCNATCPGSKNDTKTENPCAFSSEAQLAGKPIKPVHLVYRCFTQRLLHKITHFYFAQCKHGRCNTDPFAIFFNFFRVNHCYFLQSF